MAERIVLTEKQKGVLNALNEQKSKIEKEYDENDRRIRELVDFILDAKGVDIKTITSLNLEGGTLVYTLPDKQAEEISEIEPPETAVV